MLLELFKLQVLPLPLPIIKDYISLPRKQEGRRVWYQLVVLC